MPTDAPRRKVIPIASIVMEKQRINEDPFRHIPMPTCCICGGALVTCKANGYFVCDDKECHQIAREKKT